jgi:hypothetical protein
MSYDSKNLPWSIRNTKGLLWGMILGTIAVPVLIFVSIKGGWTPIIMLLFYPVIIISVMGLYMIYKPAKRFAEVIDALNFELVDVRRKGWDTLKFTTVSEGEFFLYYYSGSKHSSAYYKLWIITKKKVPISNGDELEIWGKPSWFDRKKEEKGSNKYVDVSELKDIKSLSCVRFEKIDGQNGITTIIFDKWLYSETSDVLKILKILREIEDKI